MRGADDPPETRSPPAPPEGPAEDAAPLRRAALALGFHRLGIARAGRSPHADRYLRWLDEGRHGTMGYLARNVERRVDPRESLPGARSVIVVSLPYADEVEFPPAGDASRGRIARYARGRDYHKVVGAKLRDLAATVREGDRFRTWFTVDAGPLLERDWAEAAGIGWIGKNALVIDPEIGSWFFLGVIVTDRAYTPDAAALDQCGRCTRCLDACPTGALTGGTTDERSVDARRCISYLTIEHATPLPVDRGADLEGWVFGCDICQEVCPWNTRPARRLPALEPDLAPRPLPDRLGELASLDREGFLARFAGTPVVRAGEGRLAASARAVAAAGGIPVEPPGEEPR